MFQDKVHSKSKQIYTFLLDNWAILFFIFGTKGHPRKNLVLPSSQLTSSQVILGWLSEHITFHHFVSKWQPARSFTTHFLVTHENAEISKLFWNHYFKYKVICLTYLPENNNRQHFFI